MGLSTVPGGAVFPYLEQFDGLPLLQQEVLDYGPGRARAFARPWHSAPEPSAA